MADVLASTRLRISAGRRVRSIRSPWASRISPIMAAGPRARFDRSAGTAIPSGHRKAHQATCRRRDPNHGLARSHRSTRHTDDQRGGAAAQRAPHNPDACPSNDPAGAGFRSARRAAPSCPVADRTSEKERESDRGVMRVPSEKFGLKRQVSAFFEVPSN